MNKNSSFIVAAVVVIVLAGGIIYLGKSSSKSKEETTKVSDSGEVKGASDESTAGGEAAASGEYKEKLARALTDKGAVFYGAYWCPHCKDQKKLFGEAVKFVNYVECDAKGENANPDECLAKGIKSYPTWIYQDKKYSGTQTLSQLAEMIDFNGSTAPVSDQNSDLSSPGGSDRAPSDQN